jgi:hypothetical protein
MQRQTEFFKNSVSQVWFRNFETLPLYQRWGLFAFERMMMKFLFLVLLCAFSAFAQWTEPDSTACPQPGSGVQAPWISNDNLRLYFCSSRDLAVTSRASQDSSWRPFIILPPHINLTETQRSPAESPTGDSLYFIGDPRTDCISYGSYDVYYTIRTGPCDTCWGQVFNAGPNVNTNARAYSVGISRDGSTLLVAAGYLAADLYWHTKQPDGTWGPANDFGPAINDQIWSEEHPSLSPDNQTLFFFRDSPVLYDIWSSRELNDQWQVAERLPAPVNGPGMTMEQDPCIAVDGRTLWYTKSWTRDYDFHIVISVDTSSISVTHRRNSQMYVATTLNVSIDSANELSLEISGNPLRGTYEVRIFNISGQLVEAKSVRFQHNGEKNSARLAFQNITTGTYFVSINIRGKVYSSKFVSLP